MHINLHYNLGDEFYCTVKTFSMKKLGSEAKLLFNNRMQGLYRDILSPRLRGPCVKKRGLRTSRYGTRNPVNK